MDGAADDDFGSGLFVDGSNWDFPEELQEAVEAVDCEVVVAETPAELRESVLDRLGYDERTIPPHPERNDANQFGLQEF